MRVHSSPPCKCHCVIACIRFSSCCIRIRWLISPFSARAFHHTRAYTPLPSQTRGSLRSASMATDSSSSSSSSPMHQHIRRTFESSRSAARAQKKRARHGHDGGTAFDTQQCEPGVEDDIFETARSNLASSSPLSKTVRWKGISLIAGTAFANTSMLTSFFLCIS